MFAMSYSLLVHHVRSPILNDGGTCKKLGLSIGSVLLFKTGSCNSLAVAGSPTTRLFVPTMTSSTSSRWGTGAAPGTVGGSIFRTSRCDGYQACCLSRWLADTFGYIPRQGWQIDTFGHSGVNAALYALSGMDSIFFSRLDTEVPADSLRRVPSVVSVVAMCNIFVCCAAMQDVQLRKANRQLEFLWRGTKSYSNWADIWSYAFGSGAHTVARVP